MYCLRVTSPEIRDALLGTSLAASITRDQHDVITYILSVSDGMKMNDEAQRTADVLHCAITEHWPDVLMLDNMNSRAVLRRASGKMRSADTKYMLVKSAMFSPVAASRTVTHRREPTECSSSGKIAIGILAAAVAVVILGSVAARSNTRDRD